MTVSSRDSEQSLATQPRGPGLQGEGGAARVVLLGQHHGPYARLRGAHAGDQRDAVDRGRPRSLSWTGTAGRHARHVAAQVGVDEQHVEPAALRRRALQAAQRGRAAARRGHVDVRLGGEGGGERLGEDAVVVDDQNSDANH